MANTEFFTGAQLRLLDPQVTENEIFSWPKREKAWRLRGVELSDAGAQWTKLRGYIEIRNALQHGLGRLTDHQLDGKRRTEVLSDIRTTGCYLDGNLVRLRRQDIDEAFFTCAAFVAWLDVASPIRSSSN